MFWIIKHIRLLPLFASMGTGLLLTADISRATIPADIQRDGHQPETGACFLQPGDPVAQLAFSADTLQTKGKILANPFLRMVYPDGSKVPASKIVSFSCAIRRKNGTSYFFTAKDGRLTPEMTEVIKVLLPGDELLFDQIRAGIAPEYQPKFLPPLAIRLR